jgi:hypothetical protein
MEAQAKPSAATRDLAQAGALAGAIFAALVGADPFDVRHRTWWVRTADYVAVAFWVGAVLLFLFAAASRGGTTTRFHEGVRVRIALLAAAAAGGLTMLALIAVPMGFSEDQDNVALSLTEPEQRAIAALCRVATAPLDGSVKTETLADAFVVVERIPQTHGARCDTVRVPASGILAIQEHP